MLVRWTRSAVDDLTRICDYIDEHNGAASARRVALTIYDGVNSLAQFPQLGRPQTKYTRIATSGSAFFGRLPGTQRDY